MNTFFSKWLLYYPTVLLKGELVPLYLPSYRKFQWADESAIKSYQLAKIRDIVDHAIARSAFYRDLYRGVGLCSGKDIGSLAQVASLPTIDKKTLIENKARIDVPSYRWVGTKTTGGSTGHPVQIRKNANALARERAATWRAYEWAGIAIGAPQARFWGVPHGKSAKLKAGITDLLANRRRLSAFDVSPEHLDRYYSQLLASKPVYLYGYVSVIGVLADHMRSKGLSSIPSLKAVITTSEVLTEQAKAQFEAVFKVPVFNEYGCGEVGSIAHECESGSMHLMADNLYVEVDAEGAGKAGELIVTDFFNRATPLIRYRVGDFATLSSAPCACGRGLPIVQGIHGRAYDLIRTPSGRTVHPEAVIYVFEGLQQRFRSLRQFQVIQTALDRLLVNLVVGEGWDTSHERLVMVELRRALDERISIELKYQNVIDREASGKMRLVKSAL